MKKIILTSAIAMITLVAFGQDKAKKTFPHEAGDMALVIDASPFLDYAANLLNFGAGPAAVAPTFESYQANVMGKYFLSDKNAVRVRFGIFKDNSKLRSDVIDEANVASDPNAVVTDELKFNDGFWEIGLGYEWRLGKKQDSRIQVYAGAEVFFGQGRHREIYSYGNEFTVANQDPISTNWGLYPTPPRPIDVKNPSVFAYGAAGFIGVDVFIMPQLSIGGELRIEARAVNSGKGYAQTESWDAGRQTSIITEVETPKERYFGINGNNAPGGKAFQFAAPAVFGLNLTFHF